jgi:uncharacterized membrane protein YecN with MAPEG domain
LTPKRAKRGENKMSNAYAAVSALIFTIVAVMHLVRIISRWSVVIGPRSISMNVSWAGLVVAALLGIWGFAQLG